MCAYRSAKPAGRAHLKYSYEALGNLTQTTLTAGGQINRPDYGLDYGSGHLHQINIDGKVRQGVYEEDFLRFSDGLRPGDARMPPWMRA